MTTETRHLDIAIVGAAGACGRQLAAQLLDEHAMHPDARLQLVGHRGGASESELHGLRADLRDAFADDAPTIELILDPDDIDADVLVMLAGSTVPTDPTAPVDRALLARTNHALFARFADAIADRGADAPFVIVQSNPVELGVQAFASRIGRHRVVGAGAYSDTMRFRRELADTFGVRRSDVTALMLGQHGDNLVPIWSSIRIDGVETDIVETTIETLRANRPLDGLAIEISTTRAEVLDLVGRGEVHEAFAAATALPPDLRAAVKPFLIHTTAGHTTEITTAHSVAAIIEAFARADSAVLPAQVVAEGEVGGIHGIIGLPIRLDHDGWAEIVDPDAADDEIAGLARAAAAVDVLVELVEDS